MSIEKVSIRGTNGYIFHEESSKIFFDPPSAILAADPEIQAVGETMKYIEIEVQKSYAPGLAGIFLSNSHSLSVFFVKSEVPIYMTDIVYFQLKTKLKHYVNLGPIRRAGQASKATREDTEVLEVFQYQKIGHRVKLLTFSQVVRFTYFSVGTHPGGTCLGWPLYVVKRQDRAAMAYTFGIPGACSLSQEMNKYTEKMPLLINHLHKDGAFELKDFSATVQSLASRKNHLVVTMDMVNHSIEMALHLLSLVKDRHIYVCHGGFKKLVQFCEIKRKFLSQRFGGESNTILSTAVRLNYKPLEYLLDMDPADRSIIFCEKLDYDLFFSGLPLVNLDHYSIKFFGGIESALQIEWASAIYLPKEYAHLERKDTRIHTIGTKKVELPGPALYTVELANIEQVQTVSQIAERISLYFRGTLRETDSKLVLECEASFFQKLANTPDVSQIFVDNALIYSTNNEVYQVEAKNHLIVITKLK